MGPRGLGRGVAGEVQPPVGLNEFLIRETTAVEARQGATWSTAGFPELRVRKRRF
jgi:hypothetical protein